MSFSHMAWAVDGTSHSQKGSGWFYRQIVMIIPMGAFLDRLPH